MTLQMPLNVPSQVMFETLLGAAFSPSGSRQQVYND
jgi:hypothetical protein